MSLITDAPSRRHQQSPSLTSRLSATLSTRSSTSEGAQRALRRTQLTKQAHCKPCLLPHDSPSCPQLHSLRCFCPCSGRWLSNCWRGGAGCKVATGVWLWCVGNCNQGANVCAWCCLWAAPCAQLPTHLHASPWTGALCPSSTTACCASVYVTRLKANVDPEVIVAELRKCMIRHRLCCLACRGLCRCKRMPALLGRSASPAQHRRRSRVARCHRWMS